MLRRRTHQPALTVVPPPVASPPVGELITEIFHGHEWTPAVRDGDTLLIDPNCSPADGDFVCVRRAGRCLVGDLELRSDAWVLVGAAGETLPLDATMRLLGRIVGVRRT